MSTAVGLLMSNVTLMD